MKKLMLIFIMISLFFSIYSMAFWNKKGKMKLYLKHKMSLDKNLLSYPFGAITNNRDKKYYLFDANGIKIFDEKGKLLPEISKKGRAPDENLGFFWGCVDENNQDLYLLDPKNSKIMKFDLKNYKFKKMYSLYDSEIVEIAIGEYKGKKGLYLYPGPSGQNYCLLKFLNLDTGKIEDVKSTSVKFENNDDFLKYYTLISNFGNNIALLKRSIDKEIIIYDPKKDKMRSFKLKGIDAKDEANKFYLCSNCFSEGDNFVIFGTDKNKFYAFDDKNKLYDVELVFDKEEYKNEYDYVVNNETIKNKLSDKFPTSYVMFLNKYTKEAIAFVNRENAIIFNYDIKIED